MKKGFTLIELLAVIVILAIIALIATPIILNIIEDSKEQSVKSSANLYVDGLSKYIVSKNMEREFKPSSCTISNGNISCDGTSLDYTVDGDKPTSGTISFNNGIVTGYQLYINGYTVTKSGNDVTLTKGEPTIVFNGTFVAATQYDTHKGIVYLDPTNLSTTCNAALADANLTDEETIAQYLYYDYETPVATKTLVKSGCMKFYIYDDTGDNYKMILDHNTTIAVPWISETDYLAAGGNQNDWNNYKLNILGPLTATAKLNEDTTGWVGNPRLISVDEIAHIVGADETLGWDSTSSESDVFYFNDGYAWLYDYTDSCESNGCDIEEENEFKYEEIYTALVGYWTSSAKVDGDNYAGSWYVEREGRANYDYANWALAGIRPVITIPKSIFD